MRTVFLVVCAVASVSVATPVQTTVREAGNAPPAPASYSQLSAEGPRPGTGRIGLALGGVLANNSDVFANSIGIMPGLHVDYARGISDRVSFQASVFGSQNWVSLLAGVGWQFVDSAVDLGIRAQVGGLFSLNQFEILRTSPEFSVLPMAEAGLAVSMAWSRLTWSLLLDGVALAALGRAYVFGTSLGSPGVALSYGIRPQAVIDVRLGEQLTLFLKGELLVMRSYLQIGAGLGIGW